MKIVINSCFGGFRPSDKAYDWLIKNKGWKVTTYKDRGHEDETAQLVKNPDYTGKDNFHHKYYLVDNDRNIRTNPDLIECIETLKDEANSRVSDLKVIEIPDDVDWEIDEYDGVESVHEKHRSWI